MSQPHPAGVLSDLQAAQARTLYVVATPIGNLSDLSPRAQWVLRTVGRVCAEDTRTTGVLLAHFGIQKPLTALHEHNETRLVPDLIRALQAEQSVALVSDAGTPLISDPGFVLVRAAREANIPVIAIPGPCAAVAALSIAGLATDSFRFIGFLPSKAAARRHRLHDVGSQPDTLIAYESSHRIRDTIDDLVNILGPDRRICLARELTKRFEQSVTLPAAQLARWLAADGNRDRGEFVLVIEGAPSGHAGRAEHERLLRSLLKELSPSRASSVAAEICGASKSDLYALALELRAADSPGSVE